MEYYGNCPDEFHQIILKKKEARLVNNNTQLKQCNQRKILARYTMKVTGDLHGEFIIPFSSVRVQC